MRTRLVHDDTKRPPVVDQNDASVAANKLLTLVDQNSAGWNQLLPWLRQVDTLRSVQALIR